jgi:hypothetical protein
VRRGGEQAASQRCMPPGASPPQRHAAAWRRTRSQRCVPSVPRRRQRAGPAPACPAVAARSPSAAGSESRRLREPAGGGRSPSAAGSRRLRVACGAGCGRRPQAGAREALDDGAAPAAGRGARARRAVRRGRDSDSPTRSASSPAWTGRGLTTARRRGPCTDARRGRVHRAARRRREEESERVATRRQWTRLAGERSRAVASDGPRIDALLSIDRPGCSRRRVPVGRRWRRDARLRRQAAITRTATLDHAHDGPGSRARRPWITRTTAAC